MNTKKILMMVLVAGLLLSGCGPIVPEDVETVSVLEEAGIRIEVTQAHLLDQNLNVEFFIEQDSDAAEPMYRIRMPWYITDKNGEKHESTHSAFYNVLNDGGELLPGSYRLVVTFANIMEAPEFVDIEAYIEPNFLVPDENGYLFEALLADLPIDITDPVQIQHLGFRIDGYAKTMEENSLAVTVRISASEALLETLTYPVQVEGKDNFNRSYISNRSQRAPASEGIREEILFFTDVSPDASTFSIRYPIQLRGSLPEQLSFDFIQIPVQIQ